MIIQCYVQLCCLIMKLSFRFNKKRDFYPKIYLMLYHDVAQPSCNVIANTTCNTSKTKMVCLVRKVLFKRVVIKAVINKIESLKLFNSRSKPVQISARTLFCIALANSFNVTSTRWHVKCYLSISGSRQVFDGWGRWVSTTNGSVFYYYETNLST